MKMVGVPESHFDTWASRFLARGYKITKVDQVETAIGMERRKKEQKGLKKVIFIDSPVNILLL